MTQHNSENRERTGLSAFTPEALHPQSQGWAGAGLPCVTDAARPSDAPEQKTERPRITRICLRHDKNRTFVIDFARVKVRRKICKLQPIRRRAAARGPNPALHLHSSSF